MRLCITCETRVATIPKVGQWGRKQSTYCYPCFYARPANQRAQSSRLNPHRRERIKLNQRKRVFLGRRPVFRAETVEQARAIQAYIRRRKREFVTRQQSRTQAEAPHADAVPVQAGP